MQRMGPWNFAIDIFSQPFPGSMDAFFPGAFGFMGPPLFNGPLHNQWPDYHPDPVYDGAPVDQGWGSPWHDPRPIESRADPTPDRNRRPPSRQREATQQRSPRRESIQQRNPRRESTRQRSPGRQRAKKRRPADITRRPTPSVTKKQRGPSPNRFDRPQSRRRSESRNTRQSANAIPPRHRQASRRQQSHHSRRHFEQNRDDFPHRNQWSPFPYHVVPDWNKPPPPTPDAHRPFYEPPFAYSDFSYGSQPYLPPDYRYPGEPYSPWQSVPRPYQDWPRQHRPQPPTNKFPLPMYDGAGLQGRGGQLSPLMLHLLDADVMPMFGGGSMFDL